MRIVKDYNSTEVTSCRSCDIPYKKEVNYTTVLDEFIISPENVKSKDEKFMYSGHNSAKLTFHFNKAI